VDGVRGHPGEIQPESLLAEAGWVSRLAKSLVKDDATAQDLVQETWLAALKSPPLADGRLRPWLARVLLNFARQRKRGESRRAAREALAARSERLPPATDASERIEAQRALAEALAGLPEALQSTIVLRYFDGLSPQEIAKRQDVPPGTVRWRIHRALEELREKLGKGPGALGRHWALALLPLLQRPPIATLTIQAAAGSAAGVAEGVMMMNTLTKVGIAAALVVTASVGVWVTVDRPSRAVDRSAQPDPPPAPQPLAPAPSPDADRALAAAPAPEARETAGAIAAKPAPAPAATPPAPAATGDARVEARVLDRASRPIDGAELALVAFEDLPPGTSGTDGRVHVEVDLPKPTVSSGVRISRHGFATEFQTLVLERGKTTFLGEIRLDPGSSLEGVVLAPDGTPARGAKVQATSPEMLRGLEDSRRLGPVITSGVPSATTLADGSFHIEGVRAGGARVWAGTDETRWTFTEPLDVQENSVRRGIELRLAALEPTDLIAGIVLDPDGAPVPLADVRYDGRQRGSTWSGNLPAGKDGRFRHRVQVQGAYELQVRDEKDRWPDATAVDVQPGSLDVVLRFPKPRWIEISVKSRDGAAITEFSAPVLSADKKRTLRQGKLEAHEKGKLALLVPAEAFVIAVRARGHGNAVLGPWTPDGAPSSESATLDALPGVRGRVKAAGNPLAGARVALYEMAATNTKIDCNGFPTRLHPESEDSTTTDEQGFFQLDVTRPGGSDVHRFFQRAPNDAGTFAILCEADGWALAEVSPLEIDPAVGVDGIEIALVRGGSVEGRVLTAAGKDPAGIIVGIDRFDGKPRTKRAGPDGRFRFDRLAPGGYRVTHADEEARSEHNSTSWSTGDNVHAEYSTNCSVDDGRTTRFDLDLRDDAPCVLVAHVTVNGQPATGWTAKLWPNESGTSRDLPGGAVDAQGMLRLQVPEPAKLRLSIEPRAEAGSGASFDLQVDLHRGENAQEVDLRVGAIHGRCAQRDGDWVFEYASTSKGSVACRAPVHPTADGSFELPYVLAGAGRVARDEVTGEGMTHGPITQGTVDVPEGGSVDVVVP
jgi:RNA polymerase sigma factor (sigma-70 family)